MRIIRNILLTVICIVAVGGGALFGYYRYRGNKEMALLEEGAALMEQGNYRSAIDRFARAQQYENHITRRMSDDTMEEDLFKYSGICYFRLEDFEAAASIFDRMLRLHPDDPSLLELRATVYAAQGDMEKAVEFFDRSIALEPGDYDRIYHAALTLRQYDNPEAGTKYLQQLMEEHGEDLDDLTRGQVLCFLGEYEEAVEILSQIPNRDTETTFLYASAMENTGAHQEALDLLADYDEETADSPEMLDLKGTALCGLGKYEEALPYFEEALTLSQKGTVLRRSILFNRIAALEHLRRFEEAKELAAQYAEEYPDDAHMARENLFLQTR